MKHNFFAFYTQNKHKPYEEHIAEHIQQSKALKVSPEIHSNSENTAVADTKTKAKFQTISSITIGFEYAQSLCLSSSCSAAASQTTTDGPRIIRRPLACRRNLAAWRSLCRRTIRRPELISSEEPVGFGRNGVESTMSSVEWFGDRVVDMVV
ncbi:Zinc finger, C3HC4 type (RING finger) family protein [Trifolium repens]|nr:Zinc finger, C3HC4 type (RING finger) family protein [Trifolium repens]